MKKEIERIRLKTRLAECKHSYDTAIYPSMKDSAKKELESIQEEYKSLFGEYATEFILEKEGAQKWQILSAKRSDGKTVSIGDTYEDANEQTYTIKSMQFENGRLMADTVEGGSIDLYNVKLK